MVVSVAAYQYFGANEARLPKLLPFVKKGGLIAVVVPGFIGNHGEGRLPKDVEPFRAPDWYFHPRNWQKTRREKEPGIKIISLREMDCCQKTRNEFMECPMAQEKMVPIMDAGARQYFNLIRIVGQKIQAHQVDEIAHGKTLPIFRIVRIPVFCFWQDRKTVTKHSSKRRANRKACHSGQWTNIYQDAGYHLT